jgi:hypothetical protein
MEKKADFDNAYGGQCVDLFRFYVNEVLSLGQPKGVVGAADFWTNYATDLILKNNFTQIKNTADFNPLAGDVMVWNKRVGGGFGHIAIVSDDKATLDTFNSFDQNWVKISVCEIVKHTYANVYGVLRPLKNIQEPMPDNALQECLKQHTQLVTELEAEKKKTQGLEEQVKLKDEESQRLRGEIAEKASALKTVREDLAQFLDTLAGKLTTLVDKSEVIASVDRLLSGESEQLKKIKNLEKAYALLESEKKLEIEQLKKSIDSLRTVNETQSDHITTLEKRIEAIESNDTPTQDNKAYFEAFEKVIQAIKKLFERKV